MDRTALHLEEQDYAHIQTYSNTDSDQHALDPSFIKDGKGVSKNCNFRTINNGEHIVKVANNIFRVSLAESDLNHKKGSRK